MINIYKVLEILNNNEYVEIKEQSEASNLCPFSETSYTVTLKEGGMIRIKQINALGILYRISLFVPDEKESIESWTFEKHKKGWLSSKIIKDPLFDEVESAFNNLYHKFSMEKLDRHSKYFPQ